MKKILSTLLVCLATAVGMPAHGQQITQQQTFGNFVNGLPAATLPLQSTDKLYVLQNGASKAVAGNAVGSSVGAPCTTTPFALQYNAAGLLGCVSGATSNGSTVTFANSALIIGNTTINNGSNSVFTVTLPQATANLAYQVGALTNGNCIQASGTQGGLADSGVTCGTGGTGLTVGTTTIASGTSGRVLFDNAAVLGEYAAVPVGFGGTGSTVTFSQGSVVFALSSGVYTQDNSNFFYSPTSGPGATPTLQIGPRGSSPMVATFEVYNPTAGASTARFQNSGTQSSTGGSILVSAAIPAGAAINSGSQLGSLQFGGSVDTSQTVGISSRLNGTATENWSGTANGSKLTFLTVPNTTTTPTLALTLDQNQTATFASTVTAPTVNLGTASSVTGQLVLLNSSNGNTTTLQAGAASASKTYTWPLTTGAAGSILTDAAGNGVLSWSTVSGAVSSVSNSDGTLTISPTTGAVVASINLAHGNTWTAAQTITPTLTLGVASTTTGQLIFLNNSNANTTRIQASTTAANGVLTAPAVTDTLAVLGTAQTFTAAQTITPSLTLGVASGTTGQLILLNAGGAFTTTIQAGTASASKTYTWPLTTGAAGSVLTDAAGNGTLSWGAGFTKGTFLPSSMYFGAASGNAYPSFYVPATNTNTAGQIEGIGIVGSLGADAPVTLQFNCPETIPSGTQKLRLLAMANATSGVAKLTVSDGATSAGSNIGVTTLNSETQTSQTWATADILVENKITLTNTCTSNQIETVLITFNHTSWTLTAASVWQASMVWE